MRIWVIICFSLLFGGSVVQAQQPLSEREQFIWDNLTGTFYHELAHALVHRLDIPIYGQEEDAADVLAAFLIANWHKPAEGQRIARAVALAFYADFHDYEESGRDVHWDGVHGPAMQRMFNHICIFAGSNLSRHGDFARAFGIDEDRLTYCDAEYAQARKAWQPIVNNLRTGGGEGELVVHGFTIHRQDVVGRWADSTNPRLQHLVDLATDLPIRVEPCRQANAFYDLSWSIIQMCTEQAAAHADQFDRYGTAFPIP